MAKLKQTVNISNQGFPPVSGDVIRLEYIDGTSEEITFYSNDDIPEPKDDRLPIVITSASGDGLVKMEDNYTKVWALLGANIDVTFTLDVPDTTFFLSAVQSGGVEAMFVTTVKGGVGSVKLNFDVMGQYWITNSEVNRDKEVEQFKIDPIRIDVAKGGLVK